MVTRKRNWMWRRLADRAATPQAAGRKIDFIQNKRGDTVRAHCAYPTTPALERFNAKTLQRFNGEDYCVVFHGGTTFRGDNGKVEPPARFYWKNVLGAALTEGETLHQTCKTPRCVKHRVKR